MLIPIHEIYVSQRKLRCVSQISDMILELNTGGFLPPIILNLLEDYSIQVQDGHHRLIAMYISGRKELQPYEYILVEKDQWRPAFGRTPDLLNSIKNFL